MVEKVWRNSPVEDAHASRRGPSDGQMMAQRVHLQAIAAVELGRRAGPSPVLAFEQYVLDFDRPWHGTTRTAKDFLWGHLGKFRRHVKGQTNSLLWLEAEGGLDGLLGFLCLFTRYYGSRHYGILAWPRIVAEPIGHFAALP